MHRRDSLLQALAAPVGLGDFQSRRQTRAQSLLHHINVRTRIGHDVYAVKLAGAIESQLRSMNVHQCNVATKDHTRAGGLEKTSHSEILLSPLGVHGDMISLLEVVAIRERPGYSD